MCIIENKVIIIFNIIVIGTSFPPLKPTSSSTLVVPTSPPPLVMSNTPISLGCESGSK